MEILPWKTIMKLNIVTYFECMLTKFQSSKVVILGSTSAFFNNTTTYQNKMKNKRLLWWFRVGCCERVTPLKHNWKHMDEVIWLTKGPTIYVSIMQNLKWKGITLYDETHSWVCFALCQCYSFCHNNIWPSDEHMCIPYFSFYDLFFNIGLGTKTCHIWGKTCY